MQIRTDVRFCTDRETRSNSRRYWAHDADRVHHRHARGPGRRDLSRGNLAAEASGTEKWLCCVRPISRDSPCISGRPKRTITPVLFRRPRAEFRDEGCADSRRYFPCVHPAEAPPIGAAHVFQRELQCGRRRRDDLGCARAGRPPHTAAPRLRETHAPCPGPRSFRHGRSSARASASRRAGRSRTAR